MLKRIRAFVARHFVVSAILTTLFAVPAAYAAVTATPVFVQTPKNPKLQITNGNGTTAQTLYACGANGSKITGIIVTSTDTSARDLQLLILRSATAYPLTTVTIPITAGTVAGTAPINMLSATNAPGLPVDSDGNPYLMCESTDTLQAGTLTTVTTAKFVNVIVVAADF